MTLTKAQKQSAIKYILETVFALEADNKIAKALKENDIIGPHDLVALDDSTIETLDYPVGTAHTPTLLSKGNIGLLKAFNAYYSFRDLNNNPISDADWEKITEDEFNQFRCSSDYKRYQLNGPPTPAKSVDPVREFKRGIKRDLTVYTILKDDAAWDAWNRNTMSHARAQDVADVLNPKYRPTSPQEKDLFDEKKKFMYAVFESVLKTDKGKSIVRAHHDTYDAQKVYEELAEYALKSTKASMDGSDLLTYITSASLGTGDWSGTTHAFILHWQDQIRKYHELNPKEKIYSSMQRTMLQNAVEGIPELNAVRIQADHQKVHDGKELSYDQYCSLLLSAAQTYDKKFFKKHPPKSKRHVYEHEFDTI